MLELHNLRELHHFLGIQIQCLPLGLFLTQSTYVVEILQCTGMSNCKIVPTPIALKPSSCDRDSSTIFTTYLYHILVGSLQYLTLTRSDINLSVKMLCQHMNSTQLEHIQSLKRLLRYIKETIARSIHITPGSLQPTTFSNAN